MNKLCLVFLGALLFALLLASQVQAQNTTMSPNNKTTTTMAYTSTKNFTTTTTAVNVTKDKNGGGRTEVSLVLLPLALGFLHGWS